MFDGEGLADLLTQGDEDLAAKLKQWEYGERVEIKGCWFEVTKIDLQKQRLVLKPIPRPADPEAAQRSANEERERVIARARELTRGLDK